MPQKVQFSNGTKNEYLYDATGVKHRVGYNYSTSTSLIPLGNTDPSKENNAPSAFQADYCGNLVYEKTTANGSPVLKRIVTPEGYIQMFGTNPLNNVGNWTAVYSLKDHQGNVRVNLTSDILSNNTSKVYSAADQIDYYPFGMERSNSGQSSGGPLNSGGTTPYLYSGKELDRMNGLNEHDFSARWLNNAVPGFTTPDPLAENHPDEGPYLYCGNNPVNRVDPTGLDWYWNDDNKWPIWKESTTNISGYRYHSLTAQIINEHSIDFFKADGTIDHMLNEVIVTPTNNKSNYWLYAGGGQGSPNIAPDRSRNEEDEVNSAVREETKNLINNGLITVTYNVDVFKTNNPSNKTTVVTDLHQKQVSVSTNGLTIGEDGSVTFGNSFAIGKNVITGDFILGITIPNGLNSNAGITINLDDKLVKGVAIGAVVVGGIVTCGAVPTAEALVGAALAR